MLNLKNIFVEMMIVRLTSLAVNEETDMFRNVYIDELRHLEHLRHAAGHPSHSDNDAPLAA